MEAHSLAAPRGGLTIPRSRKLLGALSDERLVDQLRRGNEAAFEVLYDRHYAALLSYCRHMLGTRDEAEDALQQAFISAHADIVSSDKPIRLKAWLYTIARNRCLSILRARREQPSDELEVISTAGLGEEVQQRADLKDLLADMRELPEDQRAALILSELGDLSHQEIAEVIGCEVGKVKSLVFQARSGLIERRQGRETPCEEIREQLATLRGGSLRRGPLRRHVKVCAGCSEFRDEVRRQRQMVAAVLPVIPTLGLKESALAAVGVSAGSAGGGALLGGGSGAIVAAKAGVAKVAVIAVATTGAVGGAVAVEQASQGGGDTTSKSQPGAGQLESSPATGSSGFGTLEDARRDAATRDSTNDKAAPGEEKSRQAREDDGRGRSEEAHAEAPGLVPDRVRGFEPEHGGSNGERARDFARERGKGRHRGLDKRAGRTEETARGGLNPKSKRGKRKQPRREHPARGQSQNPEKQPKPAHPGPRPAPALPQLPPGAASNPHAQPSPPVLVPDHGRRAQRRDERADRAERANRLG
jgi:RNA polymerase sigma factor (sigma-70 family)